MKLGDLVGRAVPNVSDWQYLNLNYVTKARIDQDLCIECGRCHIVCEDTSHQAITAMKDGRRHFEVIDAECVGCNLCVNVCPVENCITMEQLTDRRRSAHRRAGDRLPQLDAAPEQPDAGRRAGGVAAAIAPPARACPTSSNLAEPPSIRRAVSSGAIAP